MPQKTWPFSFIKPGDMARPYLPVTISNPVTGKSVRIAALIDTGADECALPESFARLLGHKIESGKPKSVSTGGGLATAYSHTALITADDFISLEATVDFVPTLRMPLIGVNSFLNRFVLTVDYPAGAFSLRY